jgi:hypothetical protein
MSTTKLFRINTYKKPVSVDSKGLIGTLSSLDATLTKNPGKEASIADQKTDQDSNPSGTGFSLC